MSSSIRPEGKSIQRIAVLRALKLGDLLCAVPALRALRCAFPTAEITLIGLPWSAEFASRYRHLIARHIAFPGFPGLPEIPPRLNEIPAFFTRMQAERFDLLIQMHGSGLLTNSIAVLCGAEQTAGYYLPGQYCPDERSFMPYPEDAHEVITHLRLMQFLGVPLKGTDMEFPLHDEDRQGARDILKRHYLEGDPYAILHPGSISAQRWPAESFAAVGRGLVERGIHVLLSGTGAEMPLTTEVNRLMEGKAVDLAGKSSLGVLGALLEGAKLLVCNDTGVSHLAAALKTPSIVLFLSSEPSRWAPLNGDLHRAVANAGSVEAQDVLQLAGELMQMENAPDRSQTVTGSIP